MKTPAKSTLNAPANKRLNKPARKSAGGPGEIRIIGGQWKRTRVSVADVPGLRPTPDRVRETLFNWLGQDLSGWRCVDAFAGSGALGFEAASRGATDVRLFESDAGLVALLLKLQARLKAETLLQISRGDGVGQLARLAPASVDLVFLDPPFDAKLHESALTVAARVLTPRGRIYLEAAERWADERFTPHGLALLRHLKAGAVHAHLLGRAA